MTIRNVAVGVETQAVRVRARRDRRAAGGVRKDPLQPAQRIAVTVTLDGETLTGHVLDVDGRRRYYDLCPSDPVSTRIEDVHAAVDAALAARAGRSRRP